MNCNKQTVLILGGAGFIGSNIISYFLDDGYNVITVDGLLEKTGGRRENLNKFISGIQFIESEIEKVKNLSEIINQSSVIIDCMGWTSHHLALSSPEHDLKLNLLSHIYFIKHLLSCKGKKVIYLGSRGQYGCPQATEITEETAAVPEDIQGIHKLAAESYFRVYSKIYGFNIISLRFPNCFGENQPTSGEDIGLVGGFIRDALNDEDIYVYGNKRKRNLAYVKDLAEVIFKLSKIEFRGFSIFNLKGEEVLIEDLVKMLIEIVGKGKCKIKPMPREIKNIDIGNSVINDSRLRELLGVIPKTDLRSTLVATVKYFKESLL